MMSSFFQAIDLLTHQNLLFVGFLSLIATGTFIGAKKLSEDRSAYVLLVVVWICLAFLVGVVRDGGGMGIIFVNPITVALIGAIFGTSHRIYLTLSNA
jgi:hypothetical protein